MLSILYKNDKAILTAIHYEDLIDFVEELKKCNPNFIDKREFKIKIGNDVIQTWKRK